MELGSAFEERRDLLRRLAARSRHNGQTASTRRFERQAAEVEADLVRLQAAIASLLTAANPA